MSYTGETSNDVQERLQREREAAAFLSSLGPQFEKARPGHGAIAGKTPPRTVVGGGMNGHRVPVNSTTVQRPVAPSVGGTVSVVTVSQEAEEKRQQALRRLKATHCSVNQDKVSTSNYINCTCKFWVNVS